MFRFRLTTGLLAVTALAVWLSTGTFEGGNLVRNHLWFMLLLTAVVSVIYYRGNRRAFWLGAALVLAMRVLPARWPLYGHAWTNELVYWPVRTLIWGESGPSEKDGIYELVKDSADMTGVLILACICGFISHAIYRNAQRCNQTTGPPPH
jgi:hypothetical protein